MLYKNSNILKARQPRALSLSRASKGTFTKGNLPIGISLEEIILTKLLIPIIIKAIIKLLGKLESKLTSIDIRYKSRLSKVQIAKFYIAATIAKEHKYIS